jgi:hypothetical protein
MSSASTTSPRHTASRPIPWHAKSYRHGVRLTLIAATLCFLSGCHLLGYNPDEADSHGKIQRPLPTP